MKYVFDTIGTRSTSGSAGKAVAGDGKDGRKGRLVTVRPGRANTEDVPENVEVRDVLVWTGFGEEKRYKEFYWPPNKKDHDLVAEFFDKMPGYLEEGVIRPSKVKSKKGLEAVEGGFREHREGKISGYKIVYEI